MTDRYMKISGDLFLSEEMLLSLLTAKSGPNDWVFFLAPAASLIIVSVSVIIFLFTERNKKREFQKNQSNNLWFKEVIFNDNIKPFFDYLLKAHTLTTKARGTGLNSDEFNALKTHLIREYRKVKHGLIICKNLPGFHEPINAVIAKSESTRDRHLMWTRKIDSYSPTETFIDLYTESFKRLTDAHLDSLT
ncbi:MAG: hypothetical protein LAT53_07345 [Idiomarina sp.]|nr:hypothetical protein [Idiomarina sp.]